MGNRVRRRYEPPVELIRLVSKTGFISKRIWEEFYFPANMSSSWKHCK